MGVEIINYFLKKNLLCTGWKHCSHVGFLCFQRVLLVEKPVLRKIKKEYMNGDFQG